MQDWYCGALKGVCARWSAQERRAEKAEAALAEARAQLAVMDSIKHENEQLTKQCTDLQAAMTRPWPCEADFVECPRFKADQDRIAALEEKLAAAEGRADAARRFIDRCVTAIDESNARIASLEAGARCHSECMTSECPEVKRLEAKIELMKKERCPVLVGKDCEMVRELEAENARLKAACCQNCTVDDCAYCQYGIRGEPAPPAPARPDAVALNRAYMEGASAQFDADKRNMKPAPDAVHALGRVAHDIATEKPSPDAALLCRDCGDADCGLHGKEDGGPGDPNCFKPKRRRRSK